MNPLHELSAAGQSPWLDFVRRTLITSGELQRLIDDGSRGVTSNPSIFEKAILGFDRLRRGARADRERRPRPRAARGVRDPRDRATSSWPPTCCGRSTTRPSGATASSRFEVEPRLARDTDGHDRGRPAPVGAARPPEPDDQDPGHARGPAGDRAGDRRGHQHQRDAAVRRRGATQQVAEAYHPRHRAPPSRRASPSTSHSVASFFVSRVDTEVDKRLRGSAARTLCAARAAIANARAAYQRFQRDLRGRALRRACATPAPASSGRCGPRPASRTRAYPDTLYVDALVGPRHREHDADGHAGRRRDHGSVAPERPRTDRRREADLEALRRRRHRHDRRHRQAARRRHRRVRQADFDALLGRHREQARGDRHAAAAERSSDHRCPTSSSRGRRTPPADGPGPDVVERIWRKDDTLWGPTRQPRSPTASAG